MPHKASLSLVYSVFYRSPVDGMQLNLVESSSGRVENLMETHCLCCESSLSYAISPNIPLTQGWSHYFVYFYSLPVSKQYCLNRLYLCRPPFVFVPLSPKCAVCHLNFTGTGFKLLHFGCCVSSVFLSVGHLQERRVRKAFVQRQHHQNHRKTDWTGLGRSHRRAQERRRNYLYIKRPKEQ